MAKLYPWYGNFASICKLIVIFFTSHPERRKVSEPHFEFRWFQPNRSFCKILCSNRKLATPCLVRCDDHVVTVVVSKGKQQAAGDFCDSIFMMSLWFYELAFFLWCLVDCTVHRGGKRRRLPTGWLFELPPMGYIGTICLMVWLLSEP